MPGPKEYDPITAMHQAARARWKHVPRFMAEAEEVLHNKLKAVDFETPLSDNRRFIQIVYGSLIDSLEVIGINEQNHSKPVLLTDPVNIAGIPGEFQFSFGFKNGDITAARELKIVRKRKKEFADEYISLCCDGTASYKLVENDREQEILAISDNPEATIQEDLLVRKVKYLKEAITRSINNPDLHPVEMRERFKLIRDNLINYFRATGVISEIYDPNDNAAIKPIKIPGTRHSWEVYLTEDQDNDPFTRTQHGTGLFIQNSVMSKGRHIKDIRQYVLWENGHAIYLENSEPVKKFELKLAEDETSSVIKNPHLLLAKFAYLENAILVPRTQNIVTGLFKRFRF